LLILTGDIGGTNTRLALASMQADGIHIDQRETFPSPDYASLGDVIRGYQPAQQAGITAAAFGVAGPVKQGVSRITNLPWKISQQALATQLNLEAVYLLNDLEAQAWGIDSLAASELISLQDSNGAPAGNRAIVAAGTGLGEAGLYFDGGAYRPFATEGGHTDFAAENAREWLLMQHLRPQYGHVSWERLVSGPGLLTLYKFLLQQHRAPAPDWLTATGEAPAAHITRLALDNSDEICVETLRWFVQLYGREAGNVALKMNATGGVYLGGGIAPRILPALQDGVFIEAFLDKGRMRPLLEGTAVQVICSDLVALKGLARYALDAGTAVKAI
jgi:glucokinase